MVSILYREGDNFSTFEYDEFSVIGCITPQDLTLEDCVPEDEGDATSLVVDHHPNNITIVTYSNRDGECRNWIGPTDTFVTAPTDGVTLRFLNVDGDPILPPSPYDEYIKTDAAREYHKRHGWIINGNVVGSNTRHIDMLKTLSELN